MKKILPYLLLLSAIIVSATAAFYSVYGLSKLFSGAALAVIIMASSLEFSKIIIAASLHSYWDKLTTLLKFYLVSAVIILVIITSAGIYGFLSDAYQVTYSKDLQVTKKIELVEFKKNTFTSKRDDLIKEKTGILKSIEELRSSLGNNVIQSVDKKTGQLIKSTSADNRRSFERQLDDAIQRRDRVDEQINIVNDSITNSEIQIIDIQNSSNAASELGPLKYISKITNKSMDTVVNWFLILLIIVFDPLALSLVLAVSFIFKTDSVTPIVKENGASSQLDNNNNRSETEGGDTPLDNFIKEHIDNSPELVYEPFDEDEKKR